MREGARPNGARRGGRGQKRARSAELGRAWLGLVKLGSVLAQGRRSVAVMGRAVGGVAIPPDPVKRALAWREGAAARWVALLRS